MDNNLNNNAENNVNIGNTIPNVSGNDSAQTNVKPTSNGVIQPVSSSSTIVTSDSLNRGINTTQTVPTAIQPTIITENPVINSNSTITPTVTSKSNKNNNIQEDYYKKFFVMMGIIVGGVLLISGVLLYFLLSGDIENRNRLTCTKNIQGEGY